MKSKYNEDGEKFAEYETKGYFRTILQTFRHVHTFTKFQAQARNHQARNQSRALQSR